MNIKDFYEEGSENQYPKFLFFKYDEFTEFINNSDKKDLMAILEDNIPFIDEDLKNVLKIIQPTNINELSVVLALSSPFKKDFLEIIRNEKIKLSLRKIKNEEIRNIVENTYYFVVFRQQFLKIIQIIWQCNEEEANIIRKEFCKKSNDINLHNTFMEKSIQIGLSPEDVVPLYRQLLSFSQLCFDQDVATEYALKIYDISKFLLEKTDKLEISNENTEFIKNLVSEINNRICFD